MLQLRNPHAVLEALKARPKDVLDIKFDASSERGLEGLGETWKEVFNLTKEKGIKVSFGASKHGDRSRPAEDRNPGDRESGAIANVREKESVLLSELFQKDDEEYGIWLALDCVQDPRNVGAIFRSASFFGVKGILLTEERSAPLTSLVYDVSTGGIEHMPFAIETNLSRAIEAAKEADVWVLGTSEHAKEDLKTVKLDRNWLIVFGNEEKGMRRLTQENCDVLVSVAPLGKTTSLNVSNAVAAVLSTLSALPRRV